MAEFRYIGVVIDAGSIRAEVRRRVGAEANILWVFKGGLERDGSGCEAKVGMCGEILVPTVLYKCEAKTLNARR